MNEEIESLRSDIVTRSQETKGLEEKIEGLLQSHANEISELKKSRDQQQENYETSLNSSRKEMDELRGVNEVHI